MIVAALPAVVVVFDVTDVTEDKPVPLSTAPTFFSAVSSSLWSSVDELSHSWTTITFNQQVLKLHLQQTTHFLPGGAGSRHPPPVCSGSVWGLHSPPRGASKTPDQMLNHLTCFTQEGAAVSLRALSRCSDSQYQPGPTNMAGFSEPTPHLDAHSLPDELTLQLTVTCEQDPEIFELL